MPSASLVVLIVTLLGSGSCARAWPALRRIPRNTRRLACFMARTIDPRPRAARRRARELSGAGRVEIAEITRPEKAEGPLSRVGLQNPGSVLLSHRVAPAVPSALKSLTSVFGMGTGGPSSVYPPGKK